MAAPARTPAVDAAPPIGTRLLEREAELTALDALLAGSAAGRGGVVVIEGEAGIGKTELLLHAGDRAARHGIRSLAARGGEIERDFPFALVRQLLQPPLASAGPAEQSALLAGSARLAAWLLAPADLGRDASHAALHGLFWLTANLAERTPLLLTVDDAHWGDEPSLRFLGFLARRLDGLPLLLALATRAGESDGAARALTEIERASPRTHLLRPARLSVAATGDFIRERLGHETAPELCATCHQLTSGNPFFLDQLVWDLRAEGLDPARVRELAPRRIHDRVQSRLARLPATATELVHAHAVLPAAAEPALVADLAGLDPATAAEATQLLVRAGLLAGEPPHFAHPIVRTGIVQALPPPRLVDLHARAARLLAATGHASESVALHLLSVPPAGDPWTVAQLRSGARDALGKGAPETAARYLERALAEPPAPALRAQVLHDLGTAKARDAQRDAVGHLAEAFELATDPRLRTLSAFELAMAHWAWWRPADAVRVTERAVAGAASRDDPLVRDLEAFHLSGAVATLPARRVLVGRLRDVDVAAAGPPMLANIALDAALGEGTAAHARGCAERALADIDALLHADGQPLRLAAIALLLADGADASVQAMDRAIAIARRQSSARGFAHSSSIRAWGHYVRGDSARAAADARAALDLMIDAGWPILMPVALSCLVHALLDRGDVRGAADALAAVERSPLEIDSESWMAQGVREARARLLLVAGQPLAALAQLDAIATWAEAWGARNPAWAPWRQGAALARHALGDRTDAVRHASDGVRVARAYGAPRPLGAALRVLAVVGDSEARVVTLDEAVAVLEASPARLERARALTDLGAALRSRGRQRDARKPLRVAADLADRCGATVLRRRAVDELLATGARPRRIAASGRDALTPGEQRIVRMAVDGMSNREIAQALFVTKKTVESHLANAYRKLGIRSRQQLAARLAEDR